jgi:exodeoxyribonuclease-3
MGLADAVRAMHPQGPIYTFWDYQGGAWQRDLGLRIDHVLLSPTLTEQLVSAVPDRAERDQPQPSDHVPVVVELG